MFSGIPGGIFAPSLAVGAGIGADLSAWFPNVPVGALIILGMGAYFTGVVQAPITAVVILMEMTDDQTITVPLMAASLIAYSISRLVCSKPLYKSLAEKFTAGMPVPGPTEIAAAERAGIAGEETEPLS
jgi:H+/Cl- antiporter ClcA